MSESKWISHVHAVPADVLHQWLLGRTRPVNDPAENDAYPLVTQQVSMENHNGHVQ